ncbi:MAG TPA: ABC transporter substrate-binding protein [Acetobacteraceae bacterium]|nr:ABC transporter substrate-binding protein [Acetobacteraceae bacterium]
MTADREHPYLPRLRNELQRGRVDRREFLRTATLLGVAAGAAFAMAGLPEPVRAQNNLPKGGKIRIGMRVQEIKDPQTISWVDPSNVLRNTVQYLTRTDQNNVTHPELLEKWEASEDLRTWTLTIRPEAKWRSGRAFTADDAIWNIKRVLNPKTGSSVLGLMKGYMLEQYDTGETKDGKPVTSVRLWSENAIEKVNDKTFRLNCKEAQLAVPEHLFHYPFFMLDPAENAAFKVGMNGTGPFELTAYNVGQNAVLKASAKYWGQPVHLDEVEFVDLGDDSGAKIAALASRQVDGIANVDFSELDAIKSLLEVVIHPVSTAQTAVVRGKYDQKPFNDVRVRQALKLAIDQRKVIDIVFRGNAAVGEHHHVAPLHPEYAKLPMVGQDIAKAKQLLAEAGYPNGLALEIACKSEPAWEAASVTVMKEMWKEAGIDVKINLMPSASFWGIWDKVPFGYTAWTHRPLGIMVLGLAYRSGVPWNESSYANPEFDKLLTQAEGILEADKRRVVMAKLEQILQDDGPIVQPLWLVVQAAFDKKVKGFQMHPTGYLFLDELAVEKT